MTRRIILILSFFNFIIIPAKAQAIDHQGARLLVKQGNASFRSGQRNDATTQYQKAVKTDSTNAQAIYNLATSMIPSEWRQTERTPEWSRLEAEKRDTMINDIVKTFNIAAAREVNPNRKQMSYFNAGVLCQGSATESQKKQQYLQQAIDLYKEALKLNPNDEDARYNLVLCMRQLKPGEGGGGGGNNNDKQEEQQQQQDQQQQQQEKQDQPQQPKEQQMSQDNVEQLLKAAMQKEEQTQREVEQKQQRSEQRRQLNEKNW